jgi:hypothetical protein
LTDSLSVKAGGNPSPHHQAQAEEIQYRPHLIDGCLAGTGLKIEPW